MFFWHWSCFEGFFLFVRKLGTSMPHSKWNNPPYYCAGAFSDPSVVFLFSARPIVALCLYLAAWVCSIGAARLECVLWGGLSLLNCHYCQASQGFHECWAVWELEISDHTEVTGLSGRRCLVRAMHLSAYLEYRDVRYQFSFSTSVCEYVCLCVCY